MHNSFSHLRYRHLLPATFLAAWLLMICSVLFSVHCAAVSGQEEASQGQSQATSEQLEFFEKEVRPLLVEHCYECHSGKSKKLQAGLRVDSRKAMLKGGDSGPALIASNPDESSIIQAVRYDGFEMPPKGKLPANEIDILTKWVAMGAPWPAEQPSDGGADRESFDWQKRKEGHWVWQSIQNPTRPTIAETDWPKSDIDFFILSSLEKAGLKPTLQADKYALVRRLYLDIIGLPPTPEQVQQFVSNTNIIGTEQLVDQLLASPHFGERWGRHWLDLVRFAESRGHEFDNDAPYAYQYRDYVIRALNADVPYDQFVREHLAGDLLKSPRLNAAEHFNESILGTGFFHLGEWVHSPVDIRKDESDRFDNMIDVMSKTFLGVTVSCARCHDHKFDAISTEDYYSIAGFLQSSDYREVAFDAMECNREIGSQLAELDQNYREKIGSILSKASPASILAMDHASKETREANMQSLSDAVIVDYAIAEPSQFFVDGELFGKRPRHAGEISLVVSDGKAKLDFVRTSAAASDLFWNSFKKQEANSPNQMSSIGKLPRSGRTLRSPTFTLRDGKVDCRIQGQGHVVACVDSHRLLAGPLHGETVRGIPKADGFQWVTLNLGRYVGHRLHLEFTPDVDTLMEVQIVTQGASPEQLKAIEASKANVANQITEAAKVIDLELQKDKDAEERVNAIVESWSKARLELQQKIRTTSRVAMSMMDGTGEDEHVLIRGNSSNPGRTVARRFLVAVDGPEPLAIEHGSGRLELAERINAATNPLASRVIVNRIWHHLMGRGIVPTTDDFGFLGQRPSHPELLDHLATKFLSDGRSLKKMIRYVVLSKTYQLGSRPDAISTQLDPKNQFWHHHAAKRLEGEAIRDALLSISGRLDPTQYGPSIKVYLSSFMDGRGRPGQNGPLDGSNRRSIYLEVRRNFLSPMFVAFDTPTPFSAMGRRNVSNVPAQALILMNDPLVAELAKAWAQRACSTVPMSEGQSPDARIRWMVMSAFSRESNEPELAAARAFLNKHGQEFGMTIRDESLWEDFAHALVNKKEFIFQR
ncbi:MAG: PSD1 and planctomycete cytochrome C domain-containing protein [Planctomycetota bacterium]|nr:PSD1 and planctomycete cytochrome C domain-containing protein [Planctomycetota bacterium]